MNRLIFLALVLIVSCSAVKQENKAKQEKPNIIIIMADDMGFSDLGCTGSEIHTPNLDKMANEGILFTKFYNTSRCSPSRASLLTGQFQWDAGIGHMDYTKSSLPEYQGYLNKKSVTIAEVLKQNDYQTFMAGKWHVGSKERDMWPDRRGFDQFYGTPSGGGVYFYPSKFYDRPVFWNGKQVYPDSTWYSTDAFTDYSIDFIKEKRKKEKPFFMYLAYIAPHYPLQAKKEDIETYKDTYKVGYAVIRNARFKKQKQLGIIPENSDISEANYPEWESVKNKEEEALEMAVYAAMVDRLDQNIGRLMQSLKDEGIADNTIVFFLSDNGASATGWNKTPDIEIGSRDSNAAYGVWYNVSNTPYRLHKSNAHEGGIITPLVMHWPSGIKNKGAKLFETAHINDLMPTCLQLAGAKYPTSYNGNGLDSLDGKSILPLLNGELQDKNRSYFWEHEGNKAIRKGNWKLVALHKKKWELYDLENDPFETNNLINFKPEKAKSLLLAYKKWSKSHGVQPWPLPK